MTNREMDEIVRKQEPLTLPADRTVKEACGHMHRRRVGAVLVTDAEGRLAGIFTGRDAVRCLAELPNAHEARLSEVMTPQPHTIGRRATAIEALRLMNDCGVRHIPIVEGEKIIGVVSKGDFRGLEHDRLDQETGMWERI
ncbi:MAG TPA: CBS domain-containing protein [Acetobacteraceae bacterium]|nr:CBS domain-containing protein [Acetobacteraceae bacterium]